MSETVPVVDHAAAIQRWNELQQAGDDAVARYKAKQDADAAMLAATADFDMPEWRRVCFEAITEARRNNQAFSITRHIREADILLRWLATGDQPTFD